MYGKKITKICLISLFLLTSANARNNPFVATKVYIEEKASLVDKGDIVEPYNANDKNRTVKIQKAAPTKIVTPQKQVVKKITQPASKVVKKVVAKKPMEEIICKKPKVITVTKTKIIKKEIKIYKYHILDFVKIEIRDDIMRINTKYKLKQQFVLKDEKKIVCDFIGKKSFYTQRETLSSHQDFHKIIIGAHPEDNYFRVVIQTPTALTNYKIDIKTDGTISIQKK